LRRILLTSSKQNNIKTHQNSKKQAGYIETTDKCAKLIFIPLTCKNEQKGENKKIKVIKKVTHSRIFYLHLHAVGHYFSLD